MFDHVTIRAADRALSWRFYNAVLSTLDIAATYRSDSVELWHDFGVVAANQDRPPTSGLHVAFAAPSRRHVDAFWQAGLDTGQPDGGAPGLRPQYSEDYYGAFVHDPDGNSVEAVHPGALRQGDGVIDHLWIRVKELAPASAFYRGIAPAAGLEVREEGGRVAFTDARSGASLSLVAGSPTANVHVAFPGSDDAVRRFHADALAAGYRSNGEPGERTQYHDGYYAAFVLDPDGNNIEFVNHHRS